MRKAAYNIIHTLTKAGYEAYLVGGCVRDLFLDHEPKDYDVATSATPDQVGALFEKTIEVGKAFGVIIVVHDGHEVEVATFRTEKMYRDGRRPDSVEFSSPEEDAQRRDFTINGLFYDIEKDEYLDFVDGVDDLRRGVLRFIGDPVQRIQEDYLRILRAVRFRHRFQLEYASELREILQQQASLVADISGERIKQELDRMLLDPHRGVAFAEMEELRILDKILPELTDLKSLQTHSDQHQEPNVLEHSFSVIAQLRPGVSLRCAWASLCHDMGKVPTAVLEDDRMHFPDHAEVGAQIFGAIADRLKFSKKDKEDIQWLIHHHHIFDQWEDMSRSRQLHYYDDERFQDLLNLHRADIFGATPADFSDRTPLREQLETIQEDYYQVLSDEQLPKHKEEFLSGEEIMEMLEIPKGPKIGEIKKQLREAQLHGEVKSKQEAEAFVKSLL